MRRVAAVSAVVIAVSVCLAAAAFAAGAAIQNGSKVTLDYTLTVDGKVLDSSQGKAPLQYTQGEGKIIPGLERQLAGLKAGDERDIVIKPEDAYGPTNPAAIKSVPLAKMPKDLKLEPGMVLEGQAADGRSFPARVIAIEGDSVMMDFNHPLAGKILNFKVKVVSVQ